MIAINTVQKSHIKMPQRQSSTIILRTNQLRLFIESLVKSPPPEITISEVKHQAITSVGTFTFRRVQNEKADAICQRLEEGSALRKKAFHSSGKHVKSNRHRLNYSGHKKARVFSPIVNMVKQQKWDNQSLL